MPCLLEFLPATKLLLDTAVGPNLLRTFLGWHDHPVVDCFKIVFMVFTRNPRVLTHPQIGLQMLLVISNCLDFDGLRSMSAFVWSSRTAIAVTLTLSKQPAGTQMKQFILVRSCYRCCVFRTNVLHIWLYWAVLLCSPKQAASSLTQQATRLSHLWFHCGWINAWSTCLTAQNVVQWWKTVVRVTRHLPLKKYKPCG